MAAAAWGLFQCSRATVFQPEHLQNVTALHCNFTELDKAEHFNKVDANTVIKPIQRTLGRYCYPKGITTAGGNSCCYAYKDC